LILPATDAVIRADGPWEHRDIAANTARFHIVEAGDGPLVILLHGFPMFWWTWRKIIPQFSENGFRVVAMDLRGYGGSDHTPHGYDPMTIAADIRGLIYSLGETKAILVGHDWGAISAWSVAAIYPDVVAGLVSVSMPHPKRLRRQILMDTVQRNALSYIYAFQLPFYAEYKLTKNDGEEVEKILRKWSGSSWPDQQTAAVYRAALLGQASAHCALEYHRWALRSIPRKDGRVYQTKMENLIKVPVLQIHGELDGAITPRTAERDNEYIQGPYDYYLMPKVGHFPHEENPDEFANIIFEWIKTVPGWTGLTHE
jgi:pimeloyl-ACP methyl ester carboxylesterase